MEPAKKKGAERLFINQRVLGQILIPSPHCCPTYASFPRKRTAVRNKLVMPVTKSPGAILHARSAARRVKGRTPEVTQESSVLSHWIMKYIHIFHPADQPSAVQICSWQI